MDVYTPREIALAAGVPGIDAAQVVAALRAAGQPCDRRGYVSHAAAVAVGRALVARAPLFSVFSSRVPVPVDRVPLLLSSTLHVGLMAVAVLMASMGLAPKAAAPQDEDVRDRMPLVFLAVPGPGGGGGGGGLRHKTPPPAAERDGRRSLSSPLPARRPPQPIEPALTPPEPKPEPLTTQQLPLIVAPVVTAPADPRDRIGVLERTPAANDSRGPGAGGGTGSGAGTGIGEGDGAGLGAGSGGGTGGGPYRPGSGIEPPKVLREVKADYTEDARRRGTSGDVVLEIVVRRDGTVGDVKVLQGLGWGLNERAADAVRQWRFSPARKLGVAVDVIVEVAVEFKLR
jgi:TonB family protein